GSKVFRGDLLVIPIEDSILYVEPIYLEATQAQLPELKKVIVSFANRLEMRNDLTTALKAVFGVSTAATPPKKGPTSKPTGPATAPGSAGELAKQALSAYRAAQGKLKAGDWAGYGAEQDKLREALEQLGKALAPALAPKKKGPDKKGPEKKAPAKKAPAKAPAKKATPAKAAAPAKAKAKPAPAN
ncbi:MAG: hypothetical protein KC503_30525, partial [Myxococcales bacterium]|nr:hypothetical protein [Myxococcales bacterium]